MHSKSSFKNKKDIIKGKRALWVTDSERFQVKKKCNMKIKRRNHHQNEKGTDCIGNIFANDTLDKDLISKIYKELIKLNTGKAT